MSTVPLRLAAEITLGRMRSPATESGPLQRPYLRAANVGDGALKLDDVKTMHFDPHEQRRYALKFGDVLVTEASGSRDRVGQTSLVDDDAAGLMFQNTLIRLRPLGKMLPRYLYWWSRHAYASGLYAHAAQGLGIWHLGADRLRSFSVHIPSLIDQERIVDFLDKQVTLLERAIEIRKRQSLLAAEWLSSQRDMALDSLMAPLVKLSHLTDFFNDGDWIESPYITEEGVRLIQTGNIGVGRYKEQGLKYVSENTFRDLRCTEVFPGDVLVSRLSPPVGRACIAPDLTDRMIASVDVAIIRSSVIEHRFMVHYMSSRRYLGLVDIASRGATMARVSRSQLGSFGILAPERKDQFFV